MNEYRKSFIYCCQSIYHFFFWQKVTSISNQSCSFMYLLSYYVLCHYEAPIYCIYTLLCLKQITHHKSDQSTCSNASHMLQQRDGGEPRHSLMWKIHGVVGVRYKTWKYEGVLGYKMILYRIGSTNGKFTADLPQFWVLCKCKARLRGDQYLQCFFTLRRNYMVKCSDEWFGIF